MPRMTNRWGVILAGGDGTRLLPLTRSISGDDRPKQFCAVIDNETLLRQTERRIASLIPPQQTVLMLTKTHEAFYAGQVEGLSSAQLVIQPGNRGTAPAILYSLLRLREMDADAVVAFFPSDHHFSNDEAFDCHLNSAYTTAASNPETVILVGIPPEAAEVEYGWIEPGKSLGGSAPDSIFRVSRFWEKPDRTLASALMERGCLWNSFIMVGHVDAFLNLIQQTLPDLMESFEAIRGLLSTTSEAMALREVYANIGLTSFSHDVLSMRTHDLAVLRASGLGWSDLGEPGRVLSARARKGVQTEWVSEPSYASEPMLVRHGIAG